MHQCNSSKKTFQRKEDYYYVSYLISDWINGEQDAKWIEGPRPCPLDEILVDGIVYIRQEWVAIARVLEQEAAHRCDDQEVEEAPGPGGHTVKISEQRGGNTVHL